MFLKDRCGNNGSYTLLRELSSGVHNNKEKSKLSKSWRVFKTDAQLHWAEYSVMLISSSMLTLLASDREALHD